MDMALMMIVGLVLMILAMALLLRATAFPKEMEAIPGSLGWPLIGESLSFISEFSSPAGIFSFMNKRQQRYGKVFKSYVLGRYMVFTTGREASKMLLTGKDGMVSLNLFYTGQKVLGPNSLLQMNGEDHKRLRRLIAEPLSIDGLKKYFHFINNLAVQMFDEWLAWYSRKAAQDFEINGYRIKKGWSVNLDVVSIHHDPQVFADPHKFDPSRFDDPIRSFSFLGFGNGPRMCPGMNLAKLEISIFIHHLVC